MTRDQVAAEILADLATWRAASVHELALHWRVVPVPFSVVLQAMIDLEEAGRIERVDPAIGIGAGGKVRLTSGGGDGF